MGAFKLLHGRASGSAASAALTVGTAVRRVRAASVLPQLATFPAANDVIVTKTSAGAGLIQMTRGKIVTPTLIPGPGASYNGVEGSGWPSGVRPTQASTTGKATPAARFLEVAQDGFTGFRDFLIVSDFPDQIDSIDVSAEGGAAAHLTTPGWWYYTDTNQIERCAYGFPVRTNAANYTGFATDATRGIEVVAVANPAAALGAGWVPFTFGIGSSRYTRHVLYPRTVLYGARVGVNPSLGAPSYPGSFTPGVDIEAIFPDWKSAAQYAAGGTVTDWSAPPHACSSPGNHVNIHVIGTAGSTVTVPIGESSLHDGRGNAAAGYSPRGYYKVTHDPGVTVSWVGFASVGAGVSFTPYLQGVTWVGVGHQFNHTHFAGFEAWPFSTLDKFWHRANGIGPDQCSWNMFDHLDDSRSPRNVSIWADMLDCDFLRWHTQSGGLAISGNWYPTIRRNCTRRDLSQNDVSNGTAAEVGERVINAGSKPWRTPYNSLTLQWIGGGTTTASISRPLNAGTIQFFDPTGTQVGTDLTIGNGSFQDLCDRINNVAGAGQATIAAKFQAVCSVSTFGDHVRDRDCGSFDWGGGTAVDGQVGTFTGQNNTFSHAPVSATAPTQFFSFYDIHMDDYQSSGGAGAFANGIRMNRQAWGFWGIQTPFYDWGMVSWVDANLFYDADTQSLGANVTGDLAGYYDGRVTNVSNARSPINFGDTGGPTWTDGNCKFQSMVYKSLGYKSGADINSATVVTDSLFTSGNANVAPASNVNTINTTVGDYTTLYPGLANRDPRPAGALVVAGNMITPHLPFDAWGVESSATVPRGAKYLEPDLSLITGAQAAELALVSLCGPNQTTDAAIYTISGKTGVGNTGSTLTLTLNVAGVDN